MPFIHPSRSQTTVATLLAAALAATGLLLDLTTPNGEAGGGVYVALVIPALWLPWRAAPVVLATLGTLLIGVGYLPHAAAPSAWLALPSRGLVVATVWIVAVAIGQYRRAVIRASRVGHLRALIDATADGVIMIDGRGTVQELNRACEQLFGYPAAEVVGHNVAMLMPSPYREEHDGYLARYRATGERRVIGRGRTVVGRRKDGSTFPVQLAVGEARHAGEAIFVGTVRDLTEREVTAHTLREAKEAAEAANRAKSQFLANMTHELRTPLNAILGYAQIMDHDATVPAAHRRAVRAILNAGNHLMELINEILDLSKIEAGAMELHPSDFSVAELVEGLADLFEGRCAEKGIGWRVENRVAGAGVVRGDRGKLRQVLINFLGNAVKFTDRGEVVLRVGRDGDSDAVHFAVEDSGAGIAPAARAAIFEPFIQAEAGRDKGGTGLGLAIAKHQVEIMGGRLELDTEVGRGSCFTFSLPLPRAVAATGGDPPAARVVGLAPGCTMDAVVADDVADNREILSQMLTTLGVSVRTATDGRAALALVAERRPDICFLDIRMVGMGGVEALAAIRAGSNTTVCVAVTAAGLVHESEALRAAGFDEVIRKPFHFEQIYACLARHLGARFRYADDLAPGAAAEVAFDPAALSLAAPLYDRLQAAARLNAFTEVEALLAEVAATSAAGSALASHLRTLLDRYDSDALLATLSRVTHD
ncbi:MAG: PAS domain S-box protein [Deltaproteobacteria bacterium]|nr:PAS domain S-box protein [Deltaproteobacteria bacterium]OIP67405.1 MAG: hypothetical protein AUK30_00800 [Nitrospirae bacterium CG2_30_70_394]PIU79729.1 MAG: hypothetical protein COS73_03010 [Nitrospirae bacterium CG06_land_8_20_14_3_00_70_43]PIW83434.1 MAG: hypothetical protein COZ96_03390 [Nitrospirae bacterium CG_4_8_14_3_um_filter_70_85]PIX84317.1 MAG: hypothetical protein COZ33_00870 [Nitrospirae bacterium CG_4_10_14_3_um_filter_70_108]PJB95194.1 MAG: hypothetical protein CO080_08980 [